MALCLRLHGGFFRLCRFDGVAAVFRQRSSADDGARAGGGAPASTLEGFARNHVPCAKQTTHAQIAMSRGVVSVAVFALVLALGAGSAPVAAKPPSCTAAHAQTWIDGGRYDLALREFTCVI